MLLVGDIGVDIVVAPERPREDGERKHSRARAGFNNGLVLRPGLVSKHLERCVAAC